MLPLMVSLHLTPEPQYPCAPILGHKLAKSSSVMVIFGQDIRWVAQLNME